jgi:carboxyl-terminal processing protease
MRSLRYVLPAVLLLGLGTLLGMTLEQRNTPPDMQRDLRKLEAAFYIITQQYVEPVDTQALTEAAITGMLEELDPHSSYISAEEIAAVQEGFRGSFGGVGIMFEVVDDTTRVITTISDGPSDRAGIMAGDRIVAVDDSSAVGFSNDDVQATLKGEIGTRVGITVVRPGLAQPIDFEVRRGRIPLYTVDAAFMVDEQTGFIRINRFAQTTHDEFREALIDLKGQGMQRLVLDLRDNGGGVMRSAVGMADELLSGGQTIVSTKSRNSQYNSVERATGGGLFEDQPVIVLVNEVSASASEIVSGALQDHDRALLVGRRTFGKGLVQAQFRLPDDAVLQMTISRYYTPAGRLIQTPYERGESNETYYEEKFESLSESMFNPSEYRDSVPDSLVYTTDSGRLVFGGGGILPDYVVVPDTNALVRAVAVKSLDFRYARSVFDADEVALRGQWSEPADFIAGYELDEEMWQGFLRFIEDDERVSLTDDPEASDAFEGVYLRSDLEGLRPELERRIKGYLARNLYGSTQWWPVTLRDDPVFQQAMGLWESASRLAAVNPELRQ